MRKEKDSLGEIEVESDKFWGASTQRNLQNFTIGKEKIPLDIIYGFSIVKKAAAIANCKLNLLSIDKKNLIVTACDEILDKKYDEHFPLFIWQTGSGTPTHMNVNEVISNIAALKSNKPLGLKDPLHPNDDVNMAQSTNDTFPSAIHIAAYQKVKNTLLPALEELKKGFDDKAFEFKDIIKVGRTHTMDAVPMTLGQEFSAFSAFIAEAIVNIKFSLQKLLKIPLGATAIGTGINAHKDYQKLAIEEICKITNEKFSVSDNLFQALSSSEAVCHMSSSLKNLSVSLFKIANDITLLASGPRCAIGELILPPNEPGSSIMPGKINPAQCESVKLVAMQVMANDSMISMANASGNFQLNVLRTVMIYNLLQSIELISDVSKTFLDHCLKGILPNLQRIKQNLDQNLMLATPLMKSIGYDKASKIVFEAHSKNKTLKEAALELNMMDEKTFDEIVNPKKMLGPYG
ncbi:MAG: Fumarate hydratase class II [Candidatus Anoxychlamydiales bacterium]|nr:Fumarate hydratase class II [Candidatus Anoxychlamydiales bacterium]